MPDIPPSRSSPLKTGRLILRPLHEQDVNTVFQLYGDWNVSKNLSRITFPFTMDAARLFVARAKTALHQGSAYTFGIFNREHQVFVGIISLRVPSLDPSYPEEWRAEDVGLGVLGYSILPAYWNRGLATECAACMIGFAFEERRLTRLQASPLQDNPASRRVLERLKFTLVETNIAEEPAYGGPSHVVDRYLLVRPGQVA